MAVKLKPTKGRFIMRPHKAGEVKTATGIIIPQAVMPEFGEVMRAFEIISVGKPLESNEYEMPKKGDNVLCPHFAGQEIRLNDLEYRLCQPEQIWAHIDGYVAQEDAEKVGKV